MSNPPYSKRFLYAMKTVIEHEGGYTVDHAGPTKYGITLRTLEQQGVDIDGDGDTDGDDIRALQDEDAYRYYWRFWWLPTSFEKLTDYEVASKVFDLAVNMGTPRAVRVLQRACRACGLDVTDDGVMGPKTLIAANSVPVFAILAAIRSEAAGFYRGLCEKKPAFAKYLRGWLNRAYA